jgi:hypothetical protein
MSLGKGIIIQLTIPPFIISVGVFFLVQFGLIQTSHDNPLLNLGYFIYSLAVLLLVNLFFVAINKIITLWLENLGCSINEFKVSLLWIFLMLIIIFLDFAFATKDLSNQFGFFLILFYFLISSGVCALIALNVPKTPTNP